MSLSGPLSEVLFPIDSLTKKPKGFAFVTYMIPENAVSALAQLDGHVFQVLIQSFPSFVSVWLYLLAYNCLDPVGAGSACHGFKTEEGKARSRAQRSRQLLV